MARLLRAFSLAVLAIGIFSCLLLAPTPATATIIDTADGLIYDTDLNITWLQDANAGGLLTWAEANAFINAMNSGARENFGFTDWRLPTALNQDGSGPCADFNCRDSELGHLFHDEFGASPRRSYLTGDPEVLALFDNLPIPCQPESGCLQDFFYWTSTVIPRPNDVNLSWVFSFSNGNQTTSPQDNRDRLWPVHAGNIPEPSTALLLASGLVAMAAGARRRR